MNMQDNPFLKSFEQWQEMGNQTMETMFTAFQQNMEQSKAFQEQMQTAVNKAVDSQFDMVMSSLKAMEAQMAEMTNTLNTLMKNQEK